MPRYGEELPAEWPDVAVVGQGPWSNGRRDRENLDAVFMIHEGGVALQVGVLRDLGDGLDGLTFFQPDDMPAVRLDCRLPRHKLL